MSIVVRNVLKDLKAGMRVGIVRSIAKKHYRSIKEKEKMFIFSLAEELFSEHLQEANIIAVQWVSNVKKDFLPNDFRKFETWLKTCVANWAQCDDLATGPIGELFVQYPELIKRTRPWRRSRNRWVRRAAAVSLIKSVKKGKNLRDVLEASRALLLDADYMVQKGYGWMLKEASTMFPEEIFVFVMEHKKTMPRTALRYAIEKMPASKRKQAMV